MDIRRAAVAGQFYPADAGELAATVDEYVQSALLTDELGSLRGLIVPHAGYRFSGSVAGVAYAALGAGQTSFATVVVLGPSHFVYVDGIATSSAREWATPLGVVPCAVDEAQKLVEYFTVVSVRDDAHETEHSIEVQLPFLQRVLEPGWSLLPLAVGHPTANAVSEVVSEYLGRPDTLVIVSTDLSHYLPYDEGRARDQVTASEIVQGSPFDIDDGAACGAYPLRGFLTATRNRGCNVELLALSSSGDSGGPLHRVVGYGSFAVTGG